MGYIPPISSTNIHFHAGDNPPSQLDNLKKELNVIIQDVNQINYQNHQQFPDYDMIRGCISQIDNVAEYLPYDFSQCSNYLKSNLSQNDFDTITHLIGSNGSLFDEIKNGNFDDASAIATSASKLINEIPK